MDLIILFWALILIAATIMNRSKQVTSKKYRPMAYRTRK